jgi:hypothetical protein
MKFEKEMNSFVKEDVVKQPTKRRPNIFETFLVQQSLSKTMNLDKKSFWKS